VAVVAVATHPTELVVEQVEQVAVVLVRVITEVQPLLQEPLIRAAVAVDHRVLESEQLVVQAS
tara:strand:- start:83 stop:271 length:189 start_codon:yes stop_codon:yes gene_type:complete